MVEQIFFLIKGLNLMDTHFNRRHFKSIYTFRHLPPFHKQSIIQLRLRFSTCFQDKTMPNKLIFFLVLGFLVIGTSLAHAQDDYKFLDESGKEIIFSRDDPFHTSSDPGSWKEFGGIENMEVKSRIRREGLEMIRILFISIPHRAAEDTEEDHIEALFVLDKDGLIVGYDDKLTSEEGVKLTSEIWINGIINYVEIYVKHTKHGTWKKKFRF